MRRGPSENAGVNAKIGHEAIGPDRHAAPLDPRLDAKARPGGKLFNRARGYSVLRRRRQNGDRDRMLGARLDGGDQRQSFFARETRRQPEIGQLRNAPRDRPRLVERHRPDFG